MKSLFRGQIKTGAGTLSVIAQASVTFDPPSVGPNAGVSSADLSVPGAKLGDFVVLSAPYDTQSVTAHGYVKAADTVVIRLFNSTGGAVDLPSGLWSIKVLR